MTPEEADALPLTQYLVMEVLAARARTGEDHWTFPTRATPAVRRLEGHGLVRWKSGIVENTILVWLTDEGRDLFLSDSYVAPGCTGTTARWCPIHGDCTCPEDETGDVQAMDDPHCPLHAVSSAHGGDS